MIHDYIVLIMWVTSLLVTLWGQHWRTRAHRLQDALEYVVEEQASGEAEETAE